MTCMRRMFRAWVFLFKATLIRCRVSVSMTASERELTDVIAKMRPVSAGKELIRIGGERDGGYLVPDDFDDGGIAACFSPGVSDLAAFEEELVTRYSIPSFLADYSVAGVPVANKAFDFEKKNIGMVNDDRSMRLEDWIERKVGRHNGKEYLLQMDIEGAEFGVLIDTPSDVLRRFRMMIIEFHAMDRMFDRTTLAMIDAIFEKVLRDFCVVHIHPNNTKPVFKAGRVEIPRVVEVTFYRRDRAVCENATLRFPHRLDRKNVPQHPDVPLPAIWRNQA